MHCSDCGGPIEVTEVDADETGAHESYECVDCGGEGSYMRTFGPTGGSVHTTGVVER